MQENRDELDPRLDGILDRALTSYAEQEPLAGLEQRVRARVSRTRRQGSSKWGIVMAIAASLAGVGIIVWTNANQVSGVQRTSALTIVSRPPKADAAVATGNHEMRNEVRMPQSSTAKRALYVMDAKSPRYAPEEPIRIEPIGIAPLSIEPIDVASAENKNVYAEGGTR